MLTFPVLWQPQSLHLGCQNFHKEKEIVRVTAVISQDH
jgi:hypothetical protein